MALGTFPVQQFPIIFSFSLFSGRLSKQLHIKQRALPEMDSSSHFSLLPFSRDPCRSTERTRLHFSVCLASLRPAHSLVCYNALQVSPAEWENSELLCLSRQERRRRRGRVYTAAYIHISSFSLIALLSARLVPAPSLASRLVSQSPLSKQFYRFLLLCVCFYIITLPPTVSIFD